MKLDFGMPWCTLRRFAPRNSVMYSMGTLNCFFRITLELIGLCIPRSIENPHHQSLALLKGEVGQVGNSGDSHYKCYHGNRKVITVTCAMKYSLNGKPPLLLFTDIVSQKSIVGLVGHLKSPCSAQEYHSGCAFKPPATGGMARGSQCLFTEGGCSIERCPRTLCYHAHP